MAHFAKYTKASCGGVSDHCKRKLKENGEHRDYGNEDIDLSRTGENYNLALVREQGERQFIADRCAEVKCLNRDDVNVMCSWVITAPREPKDPETGELGRLILNKDETRRYFEESYKFLNERYNYGSERNVVSAHVHMDETTPHMHYAFVPVVTDKKKGHEKVSAYEAVGRRDLQTFHQDLDRHMAEVFGREIGVLNQATKDGNRTKKELIAVEVSNLQNQRDSLQDDINTLENKREGLEGQINALQGQIKQKTSDLDTINAIKPEKGAFGTVKGNGVTVENIEWLKEQALPNARTYKALIKERDENRAAQKENKTLAQENNVLKKRNNDLNKQLAETKEKLSNAEKARDIYVSRADTYERNYNRTIKELNELKGLDVNRNRGR